MERMWLRRGGDGVVIGMVEGGGAAVRCWLDGEVMDQEEMRDGMVEEELRGSVPVVAAGEGKVLLGLMREKWPKVGYHSLHVGDYEYEAFTARVNAFNKRQGGCADE